MNWVIELARTKTSWRHCRLIWNESFVNRHFAASTWSTFISWLISFRFSVFLHYFCIILSATSLNLLLLLGQRRQLKWFTRSKKENEERKKKARHWHNPFDLSLSPAECVSSPSCCTLMWKKNLDLIQIKIFYHFLDSFLSSGTVANSWRSIISIIGKDLISVWSQQLMFYP